MLFNPMTLHGSSRNQSADKPRYVYFSSYYPPAATWLVDDIRRKKYRDEHPPEGGGLMVGNTALLAGLSPELHSLLEY